jgi:hypothetical protein
MLIENLNLIPSFLEESSLSLSNEDKSYIYSVIPSQIKMTKRFANGYFKEFKSAVEKKKAVLILCKTDKTSFGLLIADPIIFNEWNSSSLICAFNIEHRKEFRGRGKVW